MPTTVSVGGTTYTIGGGPTSNSPTGVSPSSVTAANRPLYPRGITGPQNLILGGPGEGPGGAADPGMTSGSPENPGNYTAFGTNVNTTPYSAADAWTIPPEQVPVIKAELVQAGLLSPRDVGNFGVMDPAAAAAYDKVLTFANSYGMTAQDALTYYLQNPVGAAAGAASSVKSASSQLFGPGVFFPEYNPANIEYGFQQQASQMTGQEQIGMVPAFTKAFQQAEAQAAQGKDIAKINKTGSLVVPQGASPVGAGNTNFGAGVQKDLANLKQQAISQATLGSGQYEQKPDPTAAAYSYLLSNDPQDVQAYGMATHMLEFLSMLGVK